MSTNEYWPTYWNPNYWNPNVYEWIYQIPGILPYVPFPPSVSAPVWPTIRFAQADPANPVELPRRHSTEAAGFDLAVKDDVEIQHGQSMAVRTGVKVQIPQGYVGQIWERSSLHKHDIATLAGVIDSDYRGEIHVVLHCHHPIELRRIKAGTRVAQLLVVPCLTRHEYVEDLAETERGSGGFGSTG